MQEIQSRFISDKYCSTMVVARYNEDISWVDKYDYMNVDIVQKDLDRNVGREASSWIHWIICNYDKIMAYYRVNDYVIFMQGNPFDHFAEDTQEKFDHYTDKDILSAYGIYQLNYVSLGEKLECGDNGEPHHRGLAIGDWKSRILGDLDRQNFTRGAQCVFRAVNVLNYSLEYWLQLYEYSITEPEFAWIMERYWKSLFNLEYKFKTDLFIHKE